MAAACDIFVNARSKWEDTQEGLTYDRSLEKGLWGLKKGERWTVSLFWYCVLCAGIGYKENEAVRSY